MSRLKIVGALSCLLLLMGCQKHSFPYYFTPNDMPEAFVAPSDEEIIELFRNTASWVYRDQNLVRDFFDGELEIEHEKYRVTIRSRHKFQDTPHQSLAFIEAPPESKLYLYYREENVLWRPKYYFLSGEDVEFCMGVVVEPSEELTNVHKAAHASSYDKSSCTSTFMSWDKREDVARSARLLKALFPHVAFGEDGIGRAGRLVY